MVAIKMGRKIRLYIFCCLNFLLFSSRVSENHIFISGKFSTFENAPLCLKLFVKFCWYFYYSLIYFFFFINAKLLFSKKLLKKGFVFMTIKNYKLKT